MTIVAAIAACTFGITTGNRLWLLPGMFFATLSINVSMWAYWATHPNAAMVIDSALLVAGLFGAATMWAGARPYLSSAQLRTPARVAMTGALLMLPSAILLDAQFHKGTDDLAARVPLAITGFIGSTMLLAGGMRVAILARRLGRAVDSLLIVGLVTYAILHISGMAFRVHVLMFIALTIIATTTVVATTLPGAERFGLTIDERDTILQVRFWPIALGSLAMAAAHTAIQADLDRGGITWPTGAITLLALGAMLFAARELAGPSKPLVLPFGKRDRALQRLPRALLDGNVRLVGQPVQRTTDKKVIGIEARPAWSTPRDNEPSIERTAADAGLQPLLDEITLNLAQAHLPAVLAGLEGDEPWLSVPLRVNADAVEQLPGLGDVDGLVLRVPDKTLARAIDAVRDHGALLQAPVAVADDLDPEIVAVETTQRGAPSISLRLVRASEISEPADVARVNFVVDDLAPPTNLAAILSRVDMAGDETVRKVGRRSF